MRYLYTILILIVSFSMSAQTVGQEYLPNPGICTTQNTAAGCDTTGVDGAGTINAENLYGVSAFSGVAYASPSAGNGEAYYGNRMYKLFKFGNATNPQFFALDVTVPPGVYTYSIWTRWGAQVDYDAGDAKKPFLRIKGNGNTDAADDATLIDVVPTNSHGLLQSDYAQTTGTVSIPAASDGSDLKIRFSVGKLGKTSSAPSNLGEIFYVDYVSLKYESALSIVDDKLNGVHVYPNPAEKFIMFSGIDDNSNVDLFNISGKLVKSMTINPRDNQIDVSDLSNGVYLVSINKYKTTLFVKK